MTSFKFRFFAVSILTALLSISAYSQVIYNSIPSTLPGNIASVGYEATGTSEFGDRVQFSNGTSRTLVGVTQTMSSWGCENGTWFGHNCVTTPGATFSHEITLNVYAVGSGDQPGLLLGSATQTFNIPYRPSADNVHCTGANAGKWFDGTTCYNGYAVNLTFNFNPVTVQNQVIYGVAYNTTHYGYAPIGESAACYTSSGGCGYDSLNVGAQTFPTTVGFNPAPTDAYLNSLFGENYCDGGVTGTGTFRLDAGCWAGFDPPVRFIASDVPTNANQCKNGGWQTRTRADGSTFRNQGDCIQYVNTGR